MISVLSILLLSASAPAQGGPIGGGYDSHYILDGVEAGDRFGHAVSDAGDVNGDGFSDVIVGAPGANLVGWGYTGSAFVYSGQDGSVLYHWNGDTGDDSFGHSVSGVGDVNQDGFDDVVVGAISATVNGYTYAGAAYLYSGADGSRLHQWNGYQSYDSFACSVSGAGDVDGDGVPDVIIGAEDAETVAGVYMAGEAWVYSGADYSALHYWGGEVTSDKFAHSVSGAGDVNKDGFADLIVGAFQATPAANAAAGTCYVYSGNDGTLLYQFNGDQAYGSFAWSVSGAGDINKDGFDDVLVGAMARDVGSSVLVGSAFVYSGANGAFLLRLDGEEEYDQFGYSVSGAGDVDLDGHADVIIGARNADPSGGYENGAAYVYSGKTGTILHKWIGESDQDDFGASVSGAGDFNADGFADLIVGATYAPAGTHSTGGSAYMYAFKAFLSGDIFHVSASTGATLNMELDFPAAAANHAYKILISASGDGPSTYGVEIPLTLDSLVIDTFYGNYPVPQYSNMHGYLDGDGLASASLTIPAGIPAGLIGNTYYLAAIANAWNQLPDHSSVYIDLVIVP
ncbi:MAG: FG-GAP repeat protein [Planctomycetes bacterium]|nr:FG-GAP repeat protein [Planctomycetota bacterium]